MPWQALIPCLPCFFRGQSEEVEVEDENAERRPLFPPPNTVLSPPRRRPTLPPLQPDSLPSASDTALVSSTRTTTPARLSAVGRGWSSPGLSSKSRERLGSISRAYQGRMHRLTQHSQPTTPSAEQSLYHPRAPSTASSALSAALSPRRQNHSFRHTTPSSPAGPSMPGDDDSRGYIGNVNSLASPRLPQADHHLLGRSVSEPRSLSHMAQDDPSQALFAHHQLPGTGGGTGFVARGRPRSATTVDRLSPLPRTKHYEQVITTDEEDVAENQSSTTEAHQSRAGYHQSSWSLYVGRHRQADAQSLERSASLPSEIDRMLQEDGDIVDRPTRQDERDREVVRMNLGLEGLGTAAATSSRRAKRREHVKGRKGR
ncbi:hypothetical protein BD324DRAFT_682647 [Kockovaella imperatae]|uniref:Uncharacterized protein n=1 Tax=Kockovaella imperatae TaxID=4999 RepID=A0A1Y1UB80_9TREE|nr:hypothetical protein BD324DRAFT_682647 [Kockovaella imperatae]ORX35298.1 hypothetical protein BD324DRAFT_682647 [Kockovaella imperatae]